MDRDVDLMVYHETYMNIIQSAPIHIHLHLWYRHISMAIFRNQQLLPKDSYYQSANDTSTLLTFYVTLAIKFIVTKNGRRFSLFLGNYNRARLTYSWSSLIFWMLYVN